MRSIREKLDIMNISKMYAVTMVLVVIFVVLGGLGFLLQRSSAGDSELYGNLYLRATTSADGSIDEGGVMSRIASESKGNYGTLARARLASNRVGTRDNAGAIAIYKEMAEDSKVDKFFQSYAHWMLAMLYAEQGDVQSIKALEAMIKEVKGTNAAFKPYMDEVYAVSTLRSGDTVRAKTMFRGLLDDDSTPADIRRRIAELDSYIHITVTEKAASIG